MRIISISCLILAVAAAAGAQDYRPAGTGGAFYFGANFPTLDGISDEFDALGLDTPGSTFMRGGTVRYSFAGGVQLGYYGGGWDFATGAIFDDGVVKNCEIGFGGHQFVGGYKTYFGERGGLFAGGGVGIVDVSYTKTISSESYGFGNVPFPESITFVSELQGTSWSAQAFSTAARTSCRNDGFTLSRSAVSGTRCWMSYDSGPRSRSRGGRARREGRAHPRAARGRGSRSCGALRGSGPPRPRVPWLASPRPRRRARARAAAAR